MTSNRYSTPAPVEMADGSPVASHVGMAVSGFPAECPVSGHMGQKICHMFRIASVWINVLILTKLTKYSKLRVVLSS